MPLCVHEDGDLNLTERDTSILLNNLRLYLSYLYQDFAFQQISHSLSFIPVYSLLIICWVDCYHCPREQNRLLLFIPENNTQDKPLFQVRWVKKKKKSCLVLQKKVKLSLSDRQGTFKQIAWASSLLFYSNQRGLLPCIALNLTLRASILEESGEKLPQDQFQHWLTFRDLCTKSYL